VANVIRIDLDDARPLEDQIAVGLRQAIAQGSLGPGEDLPSVRQLAGDLGVHWNTVARAYRRLADEGLLTVRRGRGAVTRDRPRTHARMGRAALRDRFCDAVAAGLLGGLSPPDIAGAFEDALASFGERRR
jgi:GntR family transcriptional regulator